MIPGVDAVEKAGPLVFAVGGGWGAIGGHAAWTVTVTPRVLEVQLELMQLLPQLLQPVPTLVELPFDRHRVSQRRVLFIYAFHFHQSVPKKNIGTSVD